MLPRMRERGGSIVGIGAATPRMTFTGSIIEDRIVFTHPLSAALYARRLTAFPHCNGTTKLKSVNIYAQVDLTIRRQQSSRRLFNGVAKIPRKLIFQF